MAAPFSSGGAGVGLRGKFEGRAGHGFGFRGNEWPEFTPEVARRRERSTWRWGRRWGRPTWRRRWWWRPTRRRRRRRHDSRTTGIATRQRVAANDRNLVATPIHALHIALVITSLQRVARCTAGGGAADAAGEEPETGTNRGAAGAIDGGTHCGADCGSEDGARDCRVDGRTFRCLRADPSRRIGPADLVVETELLETAPGSWQSHDRRPLRRQADAGAEKQGWEQWRVTMAGHDRGLDGGDTGRRYPFARTDAARRTFDNTHNADGARRLTWFVSVIVAARASFARHRADGW